MAANTQRLIALLEARIARYERILKRMEQALNKAGREDKDGH